MKMSKGFIIGTFFLLLCSVISAQVPAGLNYQAILRDNANVTITDTPITVKFQVRSGSAVGTLIWEETHSTSTNTIGQFDLVVGSGTWTGGSETQFDIIQWSDNSYFLGVSVFYQSSWHDFPANQLLSVPYARTAAISLDNPFGMNADTVTLIDGSLSIGAPNPGRSKVAIISQDDLSEDALFEVKRSDGQTVFAVFNEGVRIFLPTDPTTKGPKGGFAIGGFDRVKGEYSEDYLWVTPDSIRMYIDKTPDGKGPKGGFAIGGFDRVKATIDDYMVVNADSTRFYIDDAAVKGPKGGFAIGGFDRVKGTGQEYMKITNDSTRFYIDDTGAKGPKGGFAIGGFDRVKGYNQDYMRVTVDSTRFFVNDSTAGFSVASTQTGVAQKFMDINKINSFVGHESGQKTVPNFSASQGRYNAFFGYRAGYKNTTGYGNIFVGHETGFETVSGSFNVYMGYNAGKRNIIGNSNVFIGYRSGVNSISGYNVYVGQGAGEFNDTGTENTYMGSQCGIEDGKYGSPGNSNTFFGFRAGALNWIGNQNVYLGTRAGEQSYGSGRIFIGYKAGQNADADIDNILYIENSNSNTPLIFGNFASGSEEVIINGDLSYTGILGALSDARYKENLQPLGNVLDELSKLRGTYFSWKTAEYPEMVFGEGRQIGMIAQEVEKIYPELVNTTSKGYKTVDYEKFSAILLEGMKQQQKDIESLQSELQELKELILNTNQLK